MEKCAGILDIALNTPYIQLTTQRYEREVIPNPGHRPNFLPGYLHQFGVDVIIAGGTGPKAQALFAEAGIDAILGVEGTTEETIKRYVKGTLQPGASSCEHESFSHEGCINQ